MAIEDLLTDDFSWDDLSRDFNSSTVREGLSFGASLTYALNFGLKLPEIAKYVQLEIDERSTHIIETRYKNVKNSFNDVVMNKVDLLVDELTEDKANFDLYKSFNLDISQEDIELFTKNPGNLTRPEQKRRHKAYLEKIKDKSNKIFGKKFFNQEQITRELDKYLLVRDLGDVKSWLSEFDDSKEYSNLLETGFDSSDNTFKRFAIDRDSGYILMAREKKVDSYENKFLDVWGDLVQNIIIDKKSSEFKDYLVEKNYSFDNSRSAKKALSEIGGYHANLANYMTKNKKVFTEESILDSMKKYDDYSQESVENAKITAGKVLGIFLTDVASNPSQYWSQTCGKKEKCRPMYLKEYGSAVNDIMISDLWGFTVVDLDDKRAEKRQNWLASKRERKSFSGFYNIPDKFDDHRGKRPKPFIPEGVHGTVADIGEQNMIFEFQYLTTSDLAKKLVSEASDRNYAQSKKKGAHYNQ